MSDTTPARVTDLKHFELIEHEVARHRQNALRIRLGGYALVAGYVAVQGAQSHPRYMFLAPVIALAAWALDAHAEWNVRALRLLARALRGEFGPQPAALSLDTSQWSDRVSWREVILRPARAVLFHPLATLSACIAVDAAQLDTSGLNSELFWYCAVAFCAFVAVFLVAWSWWFDHFGETSTVTRPVAFSPVLQPRESAPAPRPDNATRPFGTAVG